MTATWTPASTVHRGDCITQDGADRPVQWVGRAGDWYQIRLTGGIHLSTKGDVLLPVVSRRAA